MARQRTPLEMRFHTDPQRTRQSKEAELIERATKDDAFRQALITDPKGVISTELGVQLPQGLNIKVVEETADTAYIVLPHRMRPEDLSTLKSMADESNIAAGDTGHTAIQFTCCC